MDKHRQPIYRREHDRARCGTGLLTITGGGTVAAAATTIWRSGTLAVGASFTLNTPSLTADGGTIHTLADTTFPNNVTIAGGGVVLDSDVFTSTFSGTFTGSGALTKTGSGTVILTSDTFIPKVQSSIAVPCS
jgi:fibronectin-binding autotransporter adhesin